MWCIFQHHVCVHSQWRGVGQKQASFHGALVRPELSLEQLMAGYFLYRPTFTGVFSLSCVSIVSNLLFFFLVTTIFIMHVWLLRLEENGTSLPNPVESSSVKSKGYNQAKIYAGSHIVFVSVSGPPWAKFWWPCQNWDWPLIFQNTMNCHDYSFSVSIYDSLKSRQLQMPTHSVLSVGFVWYYHLNWRKYNQDMKKIWVAFLVLLIQLYVPRLHVFGWRLHGWRTGT